ncbi:MAG: tape measure domain protein [Micavibrio sp.]|nr:tape measure domain protein [Micavibrio sp.]
MSNDAEIVIGIRGDTANAAVIKRALDGIGESGDRATSTVKKADQQLQSLERTANLAKNALFGLVGSLGIHEIIQLADGYTTLTNRLKVVTDDAGEFKTALKAVAEIARETQSSVAATGDAFSRYTLASKDLGRSQAEVLRFTQAISQSFRISGSTAQEAANAAIQLGQGLASGALRGDEFNSVSEQNSVLLNLLSKSLGKTRGELRDMAGQGQITAKLLFDTVLPAFNDLNTAAAEIEPTIGRATTVLKDRVMLLVGGFDKANGVSSTLAQSLLALADNVGEVSKAAIALAALSIPTLIQAMATSVSALTVALAANPLGLFLSIASSGVVALALYSDKIYLLGDNVTSFADIFKTVLEDINDRVGLLVQNLGFVEQFFQRFKPQSIATTGIMEPVVYDESVLAELGSGRGQLSYAEQIGLKSKIRALSREADKEQALRNTVSAQNSSIVKAGKSSIEDIFFPAGDGSAKGGTGIGALSEAAKKAEKEADASYKHFKSLIDGARTEQQRLNDTLKDLEESRGMAKTAEDAAGVETAISNVLEKMEELRIKAEVDSPVGKAFKALANEIDDSMRKSFLGAFESSEGGFKKFLSGMRATFKTFLANLAYDAAVRPILLNVLGSVGGSIGLSGSATSSILGSGTSGYAGLLGGTGSGGLSLSSLGSIGSSLLNGGLYSNTLGGIGSGIGNLLSGQAYGAMGPSYAASIGGGAFGNLGYGAIGGGLASLMGLGNSNGLISSAAGTLGALGGGAIGTSIGTILGMAGGPVGAIVGSFLGPALSGLFGKSGAPSMARSTHFTMDATGKYLNDSGTSDGSNDEQAAAFSSISQILAQKVNEFASMIGATLDFAPDAGIGQTRREGINVVVEAGKNGQGEFNIGASDLESAVKIALTGIISNSDFSGISDELENTIKIAMKNSSGDIDKAVADIQLAQQILAATADPVINVAAQINALNASLNDMMNRAMALGLPLDKITEYFDKQREAGIALINAQEDMLKAQKAGFASMEDMTKTFKDFLDGQALGADSSLNPMDRLALAQSNFGSLLSQAQGGDLSKTQDLMKAGSDLLSVGHDVYASSTSFAGLESFVRSSITAIAHAAGVPGYANGTGGAMGGVSMVGERGPELVNLSRGASVMTAGNTAGAMAYSGNVANDVVKTNAMSINMQAESVSEMKAMRSEMQRMRKIMERMTNKMMVTA